MMRRWIAGLLIVLAAACQRAPVPASHVALWQISRDGTPCGWILGTIHALPPGTSWRRPAIDAAMARADRLVMEIGEPINPTIAGKALARLAYTPGLPPPSQRLDSAGRAALIAAWGKGDAEALARLMIEDDAKDDPVLIDRLITQRNRRFAAWITARLQRPGTVFMAVGAGHLAGPGSVQDDLAKAGIAVERVQ